MLLIGVDIGGTFTDVIVYEPGTARLREAKTLSTPRDPARAIFEGLAKIGVSLTDAARFVHGTTRVTNALLEGSGAEVGVLTTEGFRDVLEMGLGHRPRLYSVKEPGRPPLTPRRLRFPVRERIRADGTVETPVDLDGLDRALDELAAATPQAIAVCLLHSYRNPAHERAVARRITERHPSVVCSISSEVVPEQGEYERFTTTVLNASVRGTVSEYLQGLGGALADGGYSRPLSIMTSSGGVVSTRQAARLPINLALSGPAGGVAAAAHVAAGAGFGNVITCDIGGTSTDVCLIKDGSPLMTNNGRIAGYPNKTFQIEINTIGAGGGSVAWRDVGGELRVGPRSAGSSPGPAAYGRGGLEPTTTDAHLLVGHLDPAASLGGEVDLRADLARAAMARLAASFDGPVALDEMELAYGILRLATVKMTGAIKEVSVARGHDPRDFVLMPFGGAGPMHATALADELGIVRVLVPPVPGNFSALGFVTAQARHDYVRTALVPADESAPDLVRALLADMTGEAREQLKTEDGVDPDEITFKPSVGMRFRGQSFDLAVPFDEVPGSAGEMVEAFHRAYAERYSYVRSGPPVEIVNCRLSAFGPPSPVAFAPPAGGAAGAGTTRVYGPDGWVEAAVRWRADLAEGDRVEGPAVVRENGSTTVVGAGWTGTVDRHRNLLLERR